MLSSSLHSLSHWSGPRSGSALIIDEGVLRNDPVPTAIFGIHVWTGNAGTIFYRSRGTLAAADGFTTRVNGVQTHGAQPWRGVDPITVSAQRITALQMIPSRQLDAATAPAVITIGSIHGGVRLNILPERVEMQGTIRTFDVPMREELLARVHRTVRTVAESAGATADVTITPYAPVTYNDPELTKRLVPALERAAGPGKLREGPLVMASEDFSLYTKTIPGVLILLGVDKAGVPEGSAAQNRGK